MATPCRGSFSLRVSRTANDSRLTDYMAPLAMKDFDDFDQTTNKHGLGTNTIFVLFDALVRLGSGDSPANTSVLHLTSHVGDRTVEKLFLSDEAANAK